MSALFKIIVYILFILNENIVHTAQSVSRISLGIFQTFDDNNKKTKNTHTSILFIVLVHG